MEICVVLLLWGLLGPFCLCRHYFYQSELLSWDEAQQNCRRLYTDLATFDSREDMDKLQRPSGLNAGAWIGLRDDPQTWKKMTSAQSSWRWSSTGETSPGGFTDWYPGEPNNNAGNNAGGSCVRILHTNTWQDWDCEQQLPSACFNGSAGNKTFTKNPAPLSWSDAQAFCRQNHVDLALIESTEDNAAIAAMPGTAAAWIGLYRIPFQWSDLSTGTFRNWSRGNPDNRGGSEYCVYENSKHEWLDEPCSWRLPSICYGPEPETRTVLKMSQTMSSNTDLTETAVLHQIQQKLREILGEQQKDLKLQMKIRLKDPELDPEPEPDRQPPCPYDL